MIDRLNFFDLYGYLIPGLTLVALAVAPLAMVGVFQPSLDVGDALGWMVLGYVVGHVVHSIAREVNPSSRFDGEMEIRDSEDVLDPGQNRLDRATLEALHWTIKVEFGLNVKDSVDQEELSRSRKQAFFLCRNWLIRRKRQGYVEQFEGMYTLSRNVAASCKVCAAYFVGWWCGGLLRAKLGLVERWDDRGAAVLLVIMVGLLGFVLALIWAWEIRERDKRSSRTVEDRLRITKIVPKLKKRQYLDRLGIGLWFFGLSAGAFLGWGLHPSATHLTAQFVLALVLCLAAKRFDAQFRLFNRHFSDTVFRDFLGAYRDPSFRKAHADQE